MTRTVKLGMGQLLVEGGEPERNFERAGKLAREAAQSGCGILLLPECMDLAWTHPAARSKALPIPGPWSDRISSLAAGHRLCICAGLTEKAEGKIYNTAILVDPTGKILLRYRKINLLEVEQPFYEVGTSLSVVHTEFGIIGVNICSDNYMDGLVLGHALARMGAQLILSPSSWTVDFSFTETDDPYGEKWYKPYHTLAGLYDLVVAGATSVGVIVGGPYEGKKMVGCSLAVGRSGIIARGPYNELSGELVTAEFAMPERNEKGTRIGGLLSAQGHKFT